MAAAKHEVAVAVGLGINRHAGNLGVGVDLLDAVGHFGPKLASAYRLARSASGSQTYLTRTSGRALIICTNAGVWIWAVPTSAKVIFLGRLLGVQRDRER